MSKVSMWWVRLNFEAWCQAKDTIAEEDALAEYKMAKKVAGEAAAQVQQQEFKKFGEKLNMEEW